MQKFISRICDRSSSISLSGDRFPDAQVLHELAVPAGSASPLRRMKSSIDLAMRCTGDGVTTTELDLGDFSFWFKSLFKLCSNMNFKPKQKPSHENEL